jgi:preprotein translocase subunit YajC
MIASLKKNDEVITAGGIHGTIVNVKENTVTLKVDDNVKVEVQKHSISSMKRKASE